MRLAAHLLQHEEFVPAGPVLQQPGAIVHACLPGERVTLEPVGPYLGRPHLSVQVSVVAAYYTQAYKL